VHQFLSVPPAPHAQAQFPDQLSLALQSPHRDQPAPSGAVLRQDESQQLNQCFICHKSKSIVTSLVIGKGQTNDKIVSVHYGKHQFAISSQLTIYFSTSLHLTETTPRPTTVPSSSPADHLVLLGGGTGLYQSQQIKTVCLPPPASESVRCRRLVPSLPQSAPQARSTWKMPLKMGLVERDVFNPNGSLPGTYSVIRSTSARVAGAIVLNLFNRENRFGCCWGNGIRVMLPRSRCRRIS